MSSVKVWDLFVRVFHWSTALLFLSNYWITEPGSQIHRYIGYTLIALVLARILWGFVGSTYARFRSFVPTPTTLFGYLPEQHKIALGIQCIGFSAVGLFILSIYGNRAKRFED